MARRRKAEVTIHLPLAYVEWEDAHANGGWQDKVDHSPALCWSVGYLYKEDRKGITLIGSGSGKNEESVGNTQYIPKKYITFKTTLTASPFGK